MKPLLTKHVVNEIFWPSIHRILFIYYYCTNAEPYVHKSYCTVHGN